MSVCACVACVSTNSCSLCCPYENIEGDRKFTSTYSGGGGASESPRLHFLSQYEIKSPVKQWKDPVAQWYKVGGWGEGAATEWWGGLLVRLCVNMTEKYRDGDVF